jgi:hypothetical protein
MTELTFTKSIIEYTIICSAYTTITASYAEDTISTTVLPAAVVITTPASVTFYHALIPSTIQGAASSSVRNPPGFFGFQSSNSTNSPLRTTPVQVSFSRTEKNWVPASKIMWISFATAAFLFIL